MDVPNEYLKKAINIALGNDFKSDITKADMEFLTVLNGDVLSFMEDGSGKSTRGVDDLTGLEYAVNLKWLDLSENNISDLTPISGLKHLKWLELDRNMLGDVSPLEGLIELEHLNIYNNSSITDLTAIGKLVNLKWIDMHYCSRDIKEGAAPLNVDKLTTLKDLEYLSIEANTIDDVSFVSELPSLTSFSCNNTYVTDLGPVQDIASRAYNDWSGEYFFNMYGQKLKEPVNVNIAAIGGEFRFKSPVVNNEIYQKKVEDTAAMYGETIKAPGFKVYEGDEEYVHVDYDHDTDELVITLDENTESGNRDVMTRVLLDYGMYMLKIDFDIEQECRQEDAEWLVSDFDIKGSCINGFSDAGAAKFERDSSVELPDKNESGEAITSIGNGAFAVEKDAKLKMSAVSLPDSIEAIGPLAFRFNNLEYVEFPDTLTTIGNIAFNGNKLRAVSLPDSVVEVGGGAFTLNEIEELKLSKNMETIHTAFGYNKMTRVDIPEGVKRIDNLTFSDNELVEISLPESLEYLSGFNNNHIESVNIPSGVTTLGKDALARNNMTSVVIPGNVKVIEKQAFRNTWHELFLESVEIQEGVEEIKGSAFVGNNLVDVVIPNSLKSLDDTAFRDNLGYDGRVHVYTLDLKNPNGFADSKYHVINPAKVVTEYVYEENVLESVDLWSGKDGESYHIGESEVSISPDFSHNAYELKSEDAQVIDLDEKTNKVVFECVKKAVADDLFVDSIDSVESVVVNLGSSIADVKSELSKFTSIVDSNGDRRDASISWSVDGVDLSSSGSYLVKGDVDLPEGLLKRSDDLEMSVNAYVIVRGNVDSDEDLEWTIDDFEYDDDIIVGFSEEGLLQLESDKNLEIPRLSPDGDVIEAIGAKAFAGRGIVSVDFPEGLEGFVINGRAFEHNDIAYVDLEEGIKSIEPLAFVDNDMKYVYIPSSLKKIGNSSFAENDIVALEFDDEVSDIALDRFSFKDNSIKSISLSNNVTKIHGEAFMGNTGYEVDGGRVRIYTQRVDESNTNNWFNDSKYHKVIVTQQ